jgi:hypothetical protein
MVANALIFFRSESWMCRTLCQEEKREQSSRTPNPSGIQV